MQRNRNIKRRKQKKKNAQRICNMKFKQKIDIAIKEIAFKFNKNTKIIRIIRNKRC